jgi:hypothetical protein
MRAGDVRHRAAERVDLLRAVAEKRARAAVTALAAVLQTGVLLDDRDQVAVDASLFGVLITERLAAVAETPLDQQLAGERAGVPDLPEVEHREPVGHRGLG